MRNFKEDILPELIDDWISKEILIDDMQGGYFITSNLYNYPEIERLFRQNRLLDLCILN